MRADRLLALLLLLQARGRMTADGLAVRLEVSTRTVYRDVQALGVAGVPVLAEPGPGGGIELLGGWRTELTGLTEPELEALLTSVSGPVREAALGKLTASLPEDSGRRALHMHERLLVDSVGWGRSADAPPRLRAVQDAVFSDRRLRIRYRRAEGDSVERLVDPLGLVLKAGTWYLLAAVQDDLRVFRLSRITGAERLEDAARRPSGFNLAAAWRDRVEEWESGRSSVVVTVRAASRSAPLLRRLAGDRLVEELSGDRIRLAFPAPEAAVAFMASFQDGVELIEPVGLRPALAEHGRGLVALYGEG